MNYIFTGAIESDVSYTSCLESILDAALEANIGKGVGKMMAGVQRAIAAVIKFIRSLISRIKNALTNRGGAKRNDVKRIGNARAALPAPKNDEDRSDRETEDQFSVTVHDTIYNSISEYNTPNHVAKVAISGLSKFAKESHSGTASTERLREIAEYAANAVTEMIDAAPVSDIPRRDCSFGDRSRVQEEYDTLLKRANEILNGLHKSCTDLQAAYQPYTTSPQIKEFSPLLAVQSKVIKHITDYSNSLGAEMNKFSSVLKPYINNPIV